ncbi:MAG: hypothetical protein MJE63_33885 [Proteobacteria bacterium]|nr:hypothetical protein [Pseudomonadota bacterium]
MYDNKTLVQAVDYQKSLFENSFTFLDAAQEQGQRLVDQVFENNTYLPENARETYAQWVDFVKQGTETYKEYVTNNFDKVREYLSEPVVATTTTKAKSTKKSE